MSQVSAAAESGCRKEGAGMEGGRIGTGAELGTGVEGGIDRVRMTGRGMWLKLRKIRSGNVIHRNLTQLYQFCG